jgi:hypothetical protein
MSSSTRQGIRVSLRAPAASSISANEINKSISGIGSIKRRDGPPANSPAEKARYEVA